MGEGCSIEELQAYLQELGMRCDIYNQDFQGPDAEPFVTPMRDGILQTAPSKHDGMLVSVLSPVEGQSVQTTAQLVADLGKTEWLKQKKGVHSAAKKVVEVKDPNAQ